MVAIECGKPLYKRSNSDISSLLDPRDEGVGPDIASLLDPLDEGVGPVKRTFYAN